MALIKLGGIAMVYIKHCCFMAVLIGNLKVDWETGITQSLTS